MSDAETPDRVIQMDVRSEREKMNDAKSGVSRRRFLQILGASSAGAALAGCADDKTQLLKPRVKSEGEGGQIPGVPVWFSSTCTECSAGCGVAVKNVDGRAIKVEGASEHPINRGGLCALGQSSLQSLYDPDRIRQPLKRTGEKGGVLQFSPISWDEALGSVAEAMAKSGKPTVFLTGEVTGAHEELYGEIKTALRAEHVVYDSMQPVELTKASEAVYGVREIPQFQFGEADFILNFGADFLETWVSPVEFARGWAEGRRRSIPAKTIHIEPRLSLTGANADLWLCSNPGSEVQLALALVKELIARSGRRQLEPGLRTYVDSIIKDTSLPEVADISGIAADKIALVASQLADAKAPLVIAGGTAASTEREFDLQVLVAILNQMTGAVGRTVLVGRGRKVKSSAEDVLALVKKLNDEAVGALVIAGTNPAFNLPGDSGFSVAARKARVVVSLASHLDETAQLADFILPSHTGLESWGVLNQQPGIYSLQQATMSPVFDTRDIGDTLLALSASLSAPIARGGEKGIFRDFVKAYWKELAVKWGKSSDFEKFWHDSLALGGFTEVVTNVEVTAPKIPFLPISFPSVRLGDHRSDHGEPIVYPFTSVKTFDGRAANRPWLQELPDPMTSAVWDAWVELHPDTAAALNVANGQMVAIRNHDGEVRASVLITPYIAKGVVAIPLGQGHRAYGRYATSVGKGSVVDLIGMKDRKSVSLLSARAEVSRIHERHTLVTLAGSDSQHGRGLAKTTLLTAAGVERSAHGAHASESEADSLHGSHHEPKQMYEQREHPLYRWGMAIDLAACTGCSACVVACYAENNIPTVGKELCSKGREMSWLRIEKYIDTEPHSEEFTVNFLPMMCQHCNNAPCEPVCPVYATYHNEEGLNAMVYNRCVGTRYCSNNCSYKVRRFNWVTIDVPEPLSWQINPDVTKRTMGVMEKCTFCVQRIAEAKDKAKDEGRLVRDGEIQPACAQSCPTQAIAFGNLNDPESRVSKLSNDKRAYKVLDHHINTQPAVSYLNDIKYRL
jgi:molybdopterin-containing oxidoreductase family iron-sulfur binding subunit